MIAAAGKLSCQLNSARLCGLATERAAAPGSLNSLSLRGLPRAAAQDPVLAHLSALRLRAALRAALRRTDSARRFGSPKR